MVHRYGKWVLLLGICLGLAIAGCAKYKAGIPLGLTDERKEAKKLFQQATDMGGKDCAPVEYAEAQATMDYADRQWDERDWDDFAEAIAVVKQKSMEAIEICSRPKEVAPAKPTPPEPTPAPEKPEDVTRPAFAFAPVYFDAGKADIRSDAIVVLDRIGLILKEHPWLRIEVAGHSDSGGSDEANMELSLKRARSVSTYVTDHYAISPHRLKVVGYGEARPVADNATREGRRMNRRVEFKTLGE